MLNLFVCDLVTISKLNYNKSQGVDNISYELLQADIDSTMQYKLPIIDNHWSTQSVPSEWKSESLILKKGNVRHSTNWCGITLQNTISQVIALILHEVFFFIMETRWRAITIHIYAYSCLGPRFGFCRTAETI